MWVFGHQGGWDEMLMVGVPVALFAGILYVAKRRAEAELRAEGAEEATVPGR